MSILAFGSLLVSLSHAAYAAYRWYTVHKPQIDAFEATIATLTPEITAAYNRAKSGN